MSHHLREGLQKSGTHVLPVLIDDDNVDVAVVVVDTRGATAKSLHLDLPFTMEGDKLDQIQRLRDDFLPLQLDLFVNDPHVLVEDFLGDRIRHRLGAGDGLER